jgi:biopolymer transport protein ExbD
LTRWDVFHAESLEMERGLSTQALREGLASGALREDDLVRPAGTSIAWGRLAEIPELAQVAESPATVASSSPEPVAPASPQARYAGAAPSDYELEAEEVAEDLHGSEPPRHASGAPPTSAESDDISFPVIQDQEARLLTPPASEGAASAWAWEDEDDEAEGHDAELDEGDSEILDALPDETDVDLFDEREHTRGPLSDPAQPSESGSQSSRVALPVVTARGWDDIRSEAETEEEEEAFSLARSGPQTVEELDLAPMVDVAFQLVLFFMVTATTVLFKTLEIPKPSNEAPPSPVAQGRSRTLDDLKDDYILVEVDSAGAMKIDREPVAADMNILVERLRQARNQTHRKAMLLSAEYATKHRNTVLALDAALEIGLGIVIARPQAPQGPGPSLVPDTAAAPRKDAAPAAARPDPRVPAVN